MGAPRIAPMANYSAGTVKEAAHGDAIALQLVVKRNTSARVDNNDPNPALLIFVDEAPGDPQSTETPGRQHHAGGTALDQFLDVLLGHPGPVTGIVNLPIPLAATARP